MSGEFTKSLEVCAAAKFELTIDSIASDKSISHRCAIFSLLSDKPSKIKNFLRNQNNIIRTKRQRQGSWPFPRLPAKGGKKKVSNET